MTEQEVNDARAKEIRAKRNILLFACDWTHMLSDRVVENQSEWATYRQALRDITTQETFPNEVVWPDAPDEGFE